MDSITLGQLVHVADDSRTRPGIVFDRPSAQKVVVAVMDRRRGPVLQTVHARALTERTTEDPDDADLRHLVKRTPVPGHRRTPGASAAQHARAAHTRGAAHRSTGR